jgi:Glycosyl hydrolases family 43
VIALWVAAARAEGEGPYAGDFPDPHVVATPDGFLAFGTNTPWAHVPVVRSADLATWTQVGDALPSLPPWAEAEGAWTWAPAVLDRGDGTWVLYFVSRDRASGLQCIGAATASAAAGPYVAADTPLVCQVALGGSIDPYPFRDADGTVSLLWKNDGNCCGGRTALWSQPLAPDGLALAGDPVEILAKDRPWEEPLVENPAMVLVDGRYHLLYSCGWWESQTYAVGHAVCDSPRGPCAKVGDAPILASGAEVWGPGGQAVFFDREGAPRLAYHGWTAPFATYAAGGSRTLRVAPLPPLAAP